MENNQTSSWFSKNMILIGDAAHPYGPGGKVLVWL